MASVVACAHDRPSPNARSFYPVGSRQNAMPRFAKKTASAAPTCAYEEERLANIARNRERMAALGVLDAARDIAHAAHAERLAEREKRAALKTSSVSTGREVAAARSVARPRAATRRSGRLSGSAPTALLDATTDAVDATLESGPPETYTAAHRAALGSAATPWTLFVDGYDDSGNRIYDKGPAGKTCHQCRQKTVCKHTSCGGCGAARGQFCGDCLFMRYGENVDEAARDPAWLCPPCRDLCNCSFCRQRKGWPPTGAMYRRAIREGFESVAHYLVLGGDGETGDAEARATDAAEAERATVSASRVRRVARSSDRAFEVEPVARKDAKGDDHVVVVRPFEKAPRSNPPVCGKKSRSANALHAPATPEKPSLPPRARKRLRREA